ncbi:MAG: lytic murein transglycosylase [Zoogloeaceae bacterium]|nr:lytic murein transglycosylase [Zoogloeaceae bacterium]
MAVLFSLAGLFYAAAAGAANPAGLPDNFLASPGAEAFLQEMRSLHDLDDADLRKRFARFSPDSRVLRLVAPPDTPARRSWRRYQARFLDHRRIQEGVLFWRRNAETLKRARERYGVPEEIIVAILGVETFYGRLTGNFVAFSALATLAFHDPRRAAFFRQELEQLLLLAREQGQDPESYRSSFAGAVGLPQFMPGSLRRYAVDFDGDGIIDLSASAADAIGSVAAFLSAHGWRENLPVAVPLRLPESFPADTLGPWLELGVRPAILEKDLRGAGIPALALAPLAAFSVPADSEKPAGGKPAAPPEKVNAEEKPPRFALIDLVTPDEPTEYWLGGENFYVLTRYNRSSFYAMSVFQLAGRIYAGNRESRPNPCRMGKKSCPADMANGASA